MYANRLMEHTSAVAAAAMPSAGSSSGLGATAAGILHGGWEAARDIQPPVEGRCTGCVVTVERDAAGGGTLNATVLGDSGFMVLAPGGTGGWTVRYTCDKERVEEQQHYFNCPFQLGTLGGGEMNTPADAFHASVALEKDDVVIVATDGLFDTLFDEDIVKMFNECVLDWLLSLLSCPSGADSAMNLFLKPQQTGGPAARSRGRGRRASDRGAVCRSVRLALPRDHRGWG